MNKLLKIVTQKPAKDTIANDLVMSEMIERESPTVSIKNVTIEASIGIYEHERDLPQALQISIDATLIDLPQAGQIVAINDVVNYEHLIEHAKTVAKSGHINLVESFADRLAGLCFQDHRIDSVTIEIARPQAFEGAQNASFRSTYKRSI